MSTLGFLRPNRYKIFVTITLFTLLFILGVASITNRFLGGGSFDIVNYIVFPLPMIFNFDLTYIFSLAFFVEILYLVILSYLISCILFFIIKKTIIIKNYKISTKKIALLSISILLIVFLLFITIQIIGGAPNYIYLEVRDAQSKELIHNISLQFFYWKGNIFGHDPCIKNIKLSDGKLNEISPISVGFSAYFDDERYYKTILILNHLERM